MKEFLVKQEARITNFATSEPDEQIREKLEVSAIPAILIFDEEGNLFHRFLDSNSGDDGVTYEGDVVPMVESLLGL